MDLWICSLVCHSYLKDLLLTFSYLCILPGKKTRTEVLTPSAWISPLVHSMLQPLVTLGPLILCQLNIFSWKACCCLSLNFILPLQQVLVTMTFCTVTKAEQDTCESSLCYSPPFWLWEFFLMTGLHTLYHEIWRRGGFVHWRVTAQRGNLGWNLWGWPSFTWRGIGKFIP